ncbi:DUF4212 domain-containing protein [Trinickia caryophylli]|nr:DUF4212 domain-containing protein [Trinickia caryophylli]TRX20145.1 DUF4212 domain-containing protein [Trinickia caryophylli]
MVMRRPAQSTPLSMPEPLTLSDEMVRAHRRYWHFNVGLIAVLMTIGFCVSFVVPLFARELSAFAFAGFSLPFYLGAQGAVLVYLALIAVYIGLMAIADRKLRRAAAQQAAETARAATP